MTLSSRVNLLFFYIFNLLYAHMAFEHLLFHCCALIFLSPIFLFLFYFVILCFIYFTLLITLIEFIFWTHLAEFLAYFTGFADLYIRQWGVRANLKANWIFVFYKPIKIDHVTWSCYEDLCDFVMKFVL